MPFALRTLRSLPRASRCGVLARRYGDFTVPAGAADNFVLPKEAIESFRRDGYVVVRNLLSEAELAPIEKTYDAVMRREIPIPGKEFCDMSQCEEGEGGIVSAGWARRLRTARTGSALSSCLSLTPCTGRAASWHNWALPSFGEPHPDRACLSLPHCWPLHPPPTRSL